MQSIVETGCKFSICVGCSYYACLVEAEIWPQIGPIGTDKLDADTFSMNPLVVSDTYIYKDVGNCLMVKNGGGYRVFLAHMEYLGETGWNRRPVDFQMWNWYCSSHACKLANTSMQLLPFDIYLLTFDEFHWVAARGGREFIDCIQFLWGSQQDCRRSTLPREDDDRSAWGRKKEYSICFSSITYTYKKLFFHNWCVLVHSMKHSSHYCLQQLQQGYRRPRPYYQILGTSRNSQVSQSTTDTTHIHPLDIYSEPELWECYSVCDHLLSHKPWLLVEVDDHRDLRQNHRIFTPIHLHYFPCRYKRPSMIIEDAHVYQGLSFDALPIE